MSKRTDQLNKQATTNSHIGHKRHYCENRMKTLQKQSKIGFHGPFTYWLTC